MTGDPLNDLFLGCALAALLEQARAEQGWPGREATRQRAYRLYEDALAEKNGSASGRTSRSTDARSRVNGPPNPTQSEDA